MKISICFKCGEEKPAALEKCLRCLTGPELQGERALSLVLNENFTAKSRLAHLSHEIKNKLKLSLPDNWYDHAREALQDPSVLSMEGISYKSNSDQHQRTSNEKSSEERSGGEDSSSLRDYVSPIRATTLHSNPFFVLGVTTRDDRKRIVELAEEKSLELDHAACNKARSDLTSPRNRLGIELAWLPGLSPRKAISMVNLLSEDPMALRSQGGLPALAHANLLASVFESIQSDQNVGDLAEVIEEIADVVESINVEDVTREINEDRAISGFPELKQSSQIESELEDRKRCYRKAIRDALNRLPAESLVTAMTIAVDSATASGEIHAPKLIDDLVDGYEVEVKEFLEKEAENVHKLITAIVASADRHVERVSGLVDKLAAVTRNWDRVAQPIQLSAKARGTSHEASNRIAYSVRNLAIDLFNNHNRIEESKRLTNLVQELFAELPEVVEVVDQDADALADISQRRSEAAAIQPICDLCERILKVIEHRPGVANVEGQRLIDEGKDLLNAAPIMTNSPTYRDAKDMLAGTLMGCAVAYGNETSKWGPCISLLEYALGLVSDTKLRQKLNENLAIVKANHASMGDLEPIQSAPSLSTINGIGVRLYGSTDMHSSDGSYMATYYFVFLFIPIFPLARYRVISTGGGYRFLGKGPLRTFDKWHIAISLGLIALMFLNA